MKQFKKISALITALAICSTMSIIPVSAEESADLPDWIPQNFAQAMQFDNQYGRTHIEDGLICCVQYKSDSYAYETEVSDLAETVFHETYRLTVPEKPDQSDTEAYAEYLRQMAELGIDELDAKYITLSDPDYCYEVTVYQPESTGNIEINQLRFRENQEEPFSTTNLTFNVSDNGEITETDIYGWVPDCISEYYAFRQQYGTVSMHENHIVFCDAENYDGGYEQFWNQEGTGEVEIVYSSSIRYKDILPPPPGDPIYRIKVYAPVKSGTVQMTWGEKQVWGSSDELFNPIVKNYQIDEDGAIHEIEPVSIMGDVNADGEFSVLDLVLFQKWLLNVPDVHLENWKNADFTEDNQLNVFDLLLMKKELIQKNQEQVDYSIAQQKNYMEKNLNQHEEAQAYIAHTFDEFLEIVESAEGEIDENSVPNGLDEAFFEDKAVIVMYTTARSSDTYTLINNIKRQQDKFIISNEVIMPLIPLPDMRYDRNIIVVNQADVQGITSIEITETIRTYDGFDAEETEAVLEYVRDWIRRNISPINADM